jgi:hypothetical protein
MAEICLSPPEIASFFLNRTQSLACIQELGTVVALSWLPLSLYWGYLLSTLLIELPFYLSFGLWYGQGATRALKLLVLANLATHPLVCYFFPALAAVLGWRFSTGYLVSEIFALVAEALVIRWYLLTPWWSCVALSVAANLTSWWLGAVAF